MSPSLSLLLVGWWLGAVPSRALVTGVRYQPQPTVVGCAAAAAAMVATRLDVPTEALALLRDLPVYRDGVSFYDVERALEQRGLHAATWSSSAEELRRLVAGGLPPIIAVDEGGKHTVVVVGFDRRGLDVLDPGAPGRTRIAWSALDEPWARAGRQVLVVWAQRPPLDGATRARRLADDRRFRAEELFARAKQLGAPSPSSLSLLEEAATLDRAVPGLVDELARQRALLHR